MLEGGFGLAEHSRELYRAGYNVTGLDYAPSTIDLLMQKVPQVNPAFGDAHALPFSDASFDGCLSPGVIEHFYAAWQAMVPRPCECSDREASSL